MINSKRTVEISLPVLRWKDLARPRALLFFFSLMCIGFGIYWWKAVRPYFKTEKAILQVPTCQIFAVESGIVASFPFEEGSLFRRGEWLLSLNQGLIAVQLTQIEGEIKTCKTQLEIEKERLERSMHTFLQMQDDMELGIGTPAAFDQILNEVQEAQQKGSDLEQEISALTAEKAGLERKIEAISSPAPFEGMVLRRYKQPGEYAAAGEAVLLVCDAKERWIETEVPEKLLGQLTIGSAASVSFGSYPGKEWKGSVRWISPLVENERIKIRIKADDFPLQPGLSAQTKIRIR